MTMFVACSEAATRLWSEFAQLPNFIGTKHHWAAVTARSSRDRSVLSPEGADVARCGYSMLGASVTVFKDLRGGGRSRYFWIVQPSRAGLCMGTQIHAGMTSGAHTCDVLRIVSGAQIGVHAFPDHYTWCQGAAGAGAISAATTFVVTTVPGLQ
jgi:hypothetical protein